MYRPIGTYLIGVGTLCALLAVHPSCLGLLAFCLRRGLLSLALAALCTLWSAHTAAKIVVRRTPALEGMQGLIMYPCLLMYTAFAMLCVY